MFSKNGQWSFKLADKVIEVPEMQPYTYPKTVTPPVPVVLPLVSKPFKFAEHKRTVCLISTVVCVAASTVLLIASQSASDEYYAFKPGNSEFDSMNLRNRQARFDQLQSRYSILKWSGLSLLAVSGVGAGFTFYLK